MMMQPMNPAPICSTFEPGFASAMMWRNGGLVGNRSGGDEQLVVRQRFAGVELHLPRLGIDRLRARRLESDVQAGEVVLVLAQIRPFLADVAHQQIRDRHARVGRFWFVADQRNVSVRRVLANGLGGDDTRRAVSDDDMVHVGSPVAEKNGRPESIDRPIPSPRPVCAA